MNSSKWLAIDPGIAIAGYALLNSDSKLLEYGAIKTKSKQPYCKRLAAIAIDFEQLITQYEPDYLAIEQPFFGRQITSAGKVLAATGVMLSVWGKFKDVEPVLLHQSSWKAALIGGRADKKAVMRLVTAQFSLPKILDDTADAIGIGLAALSGLTNNI